MLIELQGIRKRYRTEEVETTALEDVDLAVENGEFLSVMGPSGGGKSTLMNVLGMIDRADGGRYRFDGEDITDATERKLSSLRKNNIGFVFQSFNLIDELTVYQNVELPLTYNRRFAPAERRRLVEGVLERVDMAHRLRHFPKQLSGGQQQRVAVARAMVHEPRLILADEPTGNLDSEHGEAVMQMLVSLRRGGTTVVMVTHSAEAAGYGDRVVSMVDGHLLTAASQDEREPVHA